jgi:hypothetical protein
MVTLYYVDTSAAIKLLIEESHSAAFAAFFDHAAAESKFREFDVAPSRADPSRRTIAADAGFRRS